MGGAECRWGETACDKAPPTLGGTDAGGCEGAACPRGSAAGGVAGGWGGNGGKGCGEAAAADCQPLPLPRPSPLPFPLPLSSLFPLPLPLSLPFPLPLLSPLLPFRCWFWSPCRGCRESPYPRCPSHHHGSDEVPCGTTAVSEVGPPVAFGRLRSLEGFGLFGCRGSEGWPPPRLLAHAGGLDISKVLPSSTTWE